MNEIIGVLKVIYDKVIYDILISFVGGTIVTILEPEIRRFRERLESSLGSVVTRMARRVTMFASLVVIMTLCLMGILSIGYFTLNMVHLLGPPISQVEATPTLLPPTKAPTPTPTVQQTQERPNPTATPEPTRELTGVPTADIEPPAQTAQQVVDLGSPMAADILTRMKLVDKVSTPNENDGDQSPGDGGGQPPDDDGGQPPDDDGGQPPDDDGGQPPDDDSQDQETLPPGLGGTPPGQGGTPPGQGKTPPGQGGTPLGQDKAPPGQNGTPPGQDKASPDQDKMPPGQDRKK